MNVNDNTNCEELKMEIAGKFNVNSELILSTSTLENNSTVNAFMPLLGGKRKKRKGHTTPKKNKHRHKSQKFHALSFYAIKKDGTVEHVKKPCP